MKIGDTLESFGRRQCLGFSMRILTLTAWTFVLITMSPAAVRGQDASYVYPGTEWEMIATP
jgi:hypothetical protein